MKLSTLVHYRNLLREHTPGDMSTVIRTHADHALHLVQEHELQFPELTQRLGYDYQEIYQAFSNFTNSIGDIQQQIRELIASIEPEYFAESYRLYSEGFVRETTEYILNRRLTIDTNVFDYINHRIKLYGDWRHAGMIIRPGHEPWTHNMVSCDPLYLVDHNIELLQPTLNHFNEQYKSRLRTYIINESDIDRMLDVLPEQQFGFCLIYNYFNFKPIEVIRTYLSGIYNKLKPGGTVAFTFNNCDHTGAVNLTERKFMCYTPGSLVMSFCESLGYEVIQTYQIDAACTWVELKKDGMLTSLRGGQSLARIVAKSK